MNLPQPVILEMEKKLLISSLKFEKEKKFLNLFIVFEKSTGVILLKNGGGFQLKYNDLIELSDQGRTTRSVLKKYSPSDTVIHFFNIEKTLFESNYQGVDNLVNVIKNSGFTYNFSPDAMILKLKDDFEVFLNSVNSKLGMSPLDFVFETCMANDSCLKEKWFLKNIQEIFSNFDKFEGNDFHFIDKAILEKMLEPSTTSFSRNIHFRSSKFRILFILLRFSNVEFNRLIHIREENLEYLEKNGVFLIDTCDPGDEQSQLREYFFFSEGLQYLKTKQFYEDKQTIFGISSFCYGLTQLGNNSKNQKIDSNVLLKSVNKELKNLFPNKRIRTTDFKNSLLIDLLKKYPVSVIQKKTGTNFIYLKKLKIWVERNHSEQ